MRLLTRQASPTSSSSPSSTLLKFLDSDSRVRRVAEAGAGRAFLGHRVGSGSRHERQELSEPGAPRYVLNETDEAQSRSWDVEEFINVDGDVFRLRGSHDDASVEAERVEVRDGGSLVLAPCGTWAHLAGDEVV